MRKLIAGIACATALCGCNKQIFDLNYRFDRALVRWPDGTMKEIRLDSWRDYEGEQLQLHGKDGKVYVVSSLNTVLVRD